MQAMKQVKRAQIQRQAADLRKEQAERERQEAVTKQNEFCFQLRSLEEKNKTLEEKLARALRSAASERLNVSAANSKCDALQQQIDNLLATTEQAEVTLAKW